MYIYIFIYVHMRKHLYLEYKKNFYNSIIMSNALLKISKILRTLLKIHEMSIIIEKMLNILSWKSKINLQ